MRPLAFASALIVLGWLAVTAGLAALVLGLLAILLRVILHDYYSERLYSGIYAGALLLIVGALGAIAGRRSSTGVALACSFAALLALLGSGAGIAGVLHERAAILGQRTALDGSGASLRNFLLVRCLIVAGLCATGVLLSASLLVVACAGRSKRCRRGRAGGPPEASQMVTVGLGASTELPPHVELYIPPRPEPYSPESAGVGLEDSGTVEATAPPAYDEWLASIQQ